MSLERFDRLDLLVNNAGIMMSPYKVTEDGYENQLATNYIGHFALTGRLMPLKLESAYCPPGRVILKDKLDDRFGYFKSIGIKNVKELIQLLKKKDKFAELSMIDCLPGDY